MTEIDAIYTNTENGDTERIVAIIPAHNEVSRVGHVISVLKGLPQIDRVIVVDDGSTDGTSAAALNAGAEVITLERNRGKAAAMDEGVQQTDEPVILFLDADLTNLKEHHVIELLQPVLDKNVDMTMGVFRNGRFRTDIAHKISPGLSGQRAMRREVWSHLDSSRPMESIGYGIENELQTLVKNGKITLKIVNWNGVSQITKEEKLGPQKGLKLRMRMYRDIIKTWTKHLML